MTHTKRKGMMTHTATPWTQDVDHQNKPNNLITDADNNVVAMSEWHPEGINDWNTSVANAAFIVRACNAHADLLEALETLERAHIKGFVDLKNFKKKTTKAIQKARGQ